MQQKMSSVFNRCLFVLTAAAVTSSDLKRALMRLDGLEQFSEVALAEAAAATRLASKATSVRPLLSVISRDADGCSGYSSPGNPEHSADAWAVRQARAARLLHRTAL